VRRDLTTRQDTSGDQFVMAIEGQEIRDRGIAGELLLRRAEKLRGSRAERQVGSIAGFHVWIADNFMGGSEILLRAATYPAKVTDTAHGTIRSVEHTIQHLEEVAETLARNLADTRKRLADTQAQVNAPFEYGARLAELVQRQQQIEDELDLTKNQASAQLGTGSAGEAATVETDADSPKEDYAGRWY
jgi:hypothetical protein